MRISILSLRTLAYSEDAIRALPFGKTEISRLLAIQNTSRATAGFGALSALQLLVEDQSYPICRQAAGKPYFDAPNAPFFSLSHSDTLAVAALTTFYDGEVGIDVEDVRPCPQATRIAARFFNASERARLEKSPTDETFLTLWTAKEAVAKRDGQGLASALSVPMTGGYTKSFRLLGDGTDAILCLATNRPIEEIEWHCPPMIQISEI